MEALTVLCVLRSGGDYTPEYVRRLRDGVARHLTIPYRFVCLSDCEVPCERIPLVHDWPGWWAKIELFRPGVVTGPTLYMDLDTVIVANIDKVATIPYDFAMVDVKPIPNGTTLGMSGLLWFRKPQPHVYEKFAERPDYWIKFHKENVRARYLGDQAFINDCYDCRPERIERHLPGFALSYKWHCRQRVPRGTAIVAFGGHPRPHEVRRGWVRDHWR